jgi:predicted transcriptional regulator
MMDDAELNEHYSDPAKREVAGPPRRRSHDRMSEHVRVRFPRELIDSVKELARADGVSVSNWIRTAVTDEVDRRSASWTGSLWGTHEGDRFEVLNRYFASIEVPASFDSQTLTGDEPAAS